MNQYHNIPAELRQRMQWVVCGDDKKPRNPRTSELADVNDPSTWGSFNEACNNGMKHIGFVFTKGDPYCGIDIDDKAKDPASEAELRNHQVILTRFAAYTELSVGDRWFDGQGRQRGGYHIIIRGKVDQGRDHGHVGVYDSGRFFTFTGRVVRDAPIIDYQPVLDELVAGMPKTGNISDLEESEGWLSDAEVHEMACNAVNGDKYVALCACTSCTGEGVHKVHGSYTELGYPSQNEADFALLSILAFYTRDNAQVRRIFRCTGLGKRSKAMRNDIYLNRSLAKIRADEPTNVDFDNLRQDVERMFKGHSTDPVMDKALAQDAAYLVAMGQDPGPTLQDVGLVPAMLENNKPVPMLAPPAPAPARTSAPPTPVTAPPPPMPIPVAPPVPAAAPQASRTPPGTTRAFNLVPPGLVGEIAQYIYATSVRPVREVSLVAALGLVAGITGRAYNVSGTGLNQYLLLVATTGAGKEDGPKGVERLLSALRPMVPGIDDFVGPGAFASGQGLVRTLDTQPSIVSMLGEFGLTLQTLNDPRAPASTQLLKRALLDLYSKSGWNNVLRETAYSDKEKNTKTVFAPALSFMGDTTPETLFNNLSSADVADGLLPRMTIIEYKGKRPSRNRANGAAPEGMLVEHLASVAQSALTMRNENRNVPVPMDSDGQALLDGFDKACDEKMREDGVGTVVLQLWNRAHLKALKVAALLAVGVNHHNPVITGELAQWAIDLITRTTNDILLRFNDGDVGTGESRQRNELRRLVEEYYKATPKQLVAYRSKPEWRDAGVIPYSFLAMRVSHMAAFTNAHFKSPSMLLREALEILVASEWLGIVPKQQALDKFKTRQVLYYMGEAWPKSC